MKSWARALALLAILAPRASGSEPSLPPKTLTSICYHRFGAETAKDPYKISIARLDAELRWLQGQGYETISLKALEEALVRGPQSLPQKSLILSVDDGYTEGLQGAAEFEKYGFRGVFFINPGTLGHGRFMTWQACRDLEKRGHDVASHSLSHPNLAKPETGDSPAGYKAWVTRELVVSRRLLEKELGHAVTALAYPYGAYNPAVSAAAVRAGYGLHFTVSDGMQYVAGLDPLRIRRILLMGHPSQLRFEKRLQLQPMENRFTTMGEGALFFENSAPLALVATDPGLKLTVDGEPVSELPGTQKPGFHFLTLSQGARQTKLLFQVARNAWAPHFKALTEN